MASFLQEAHGRLTAQRQIYIAEQLGLGKALFQEFRKELRVGTAWSAQIEPRQRPLRWRFSSLWSEVQRVLVIACNPYVIDICLPFCWFGLVKPQSAGIGSDDGSFSFLRRHQLWSAQEGGLHVTTEKPSKSKKQR